MIRGPAGIADAVVVVVFEIKSYVEEEDVERFTDKGELAIKNLSLKKKALPKKKKWKSLNFAIKKKKPETNTFITQTYPPFTTK